MHKQMDENEAKELVGTKYKEALDKYEIADATYTLYGFFKDCLENPKDTDLAEVAKYYEECSKYLTPEDDETIQNLYEYFYGNIEYLIQSILKAKPI